METSKHFRQIPRIFLYKDLAGKFGYHNTGVKTKKQEFLRIEIGIS